jgi:hypothetical protein
MDKQPSKKDSPKKSNPFKDDFDINEDEQTLLQSTMNTNSDKFRNQILGEKLTDFKETAIESKLSGKNINRRRSSKFLSKEDIKITDVRNSLNSIGVLSKPDDENLIIREMPKISEQNFDEFRNSIIQDSNILKKLYEYLNSINCNFKSFSCEQSVGGISPLALLIESYFMTKEKINEMNSEYNLLKKYIYNYRTIYGDGNCYYRAVMFRYLEILILSNEIDTLRNLVFDLVYCFNNSEELKKRKIILNNDIKPDLTFKILFLIVDLLKNNMIKEAHQILVKCFVTCKKFDYAVILYFRYILYDYIKKNENKIYLKSFPIKIGNLLPCQFETESGEFLFNSFYENYLLKFFIDAEKIIIYLTPFVLGIELDVIIFEANQDEILQKFVYEGKSGINTNDVITLLNSKNHYEIAYSKNDNEKYKNYFQIYENNLKPRFFEPKENYVEEDDDDDFNLLKSLAPKTEIIKKKPNINDMYNNNQDKGSRNVENKDNNIKYEAEYKNNNNLNVENNNQNKNNYPKKNIDNNTSKNNNYENMKINNNIPSHLNKNDIDQTNSNNNNNINNNLHNNVNNKNKQKDKDKDNINQKHNNINSNDNINPKTALPSKKDHLKVNNQNDTKKENLNNHHHREDQTNKMNPNTAINPNSKREKGKEKDQMKEQDYNPQTKIIKNNTNNKNFDTGEKKSKNNINNPRKESNETPYIENKGQLFTKCFMCLKKFESKEKYCELCIRQRMFDVLYDYYQNPNHQIDEKNFFLDQYIIRNNNNYKKKINREEILKNIKDRKLCLFEREHQKYQQKLPCGCHICNYVIEFIKKYNFVTSFRCKCSKKYNRVEMILLELLFEEIDKAVSSNIIIYFSKRFDNCVLCDSHLSKKNNLIKNMSIPKEINNNITKFINRNNHYVCDKCIKKVGSEFLCRVCNIKHLINK